MCAEELDHGRDRTNAVGHLPPAVALVREQHVEIAAIQGSLWAKKVAKLTMPKRSTPATKRSGNSVTPAIVM
jgi:hypothetical protein